MNNSQLKNNEPTQSKNLKAQWMTPKQKDKFEMNDSCCVCKRTFGKYLLKQHHCRYCAKSVCSDCSKCKINDQKSCDICVMKVELKKDIDQTKETLMIQGKLLSRMKIQIKETEEFSSQKDILTQDKVASMMQLKIQQDLWLEQIEANCGKINEQIKIKQENNFRQIKTIQVDQQAIKDKEAEIAKMKAQIYNTETDVASKKEQLESKKQQYENLQQQEQDLITGRSYLQMEEEDLRANQRKTLQQSGLGQSMIDTFQPSDLNDTQQTNPRESFKNKSLIKSISETQLQNTNNFLPNSNLNGKDKNTLLSKPTNSRPSYNRPSSMARKQKKNRIMENDLTSAQQESIDEVQLGNKKDNECKLF